MDRFQYVVARSPEHAVELLRDEDNKTKIHAGGQDLLGELKHHLLAPELLVDISGIEELHSIKTNGGGLYIGATVTLAEIEENEFIRTRHTALAEAASVVGSPQIRNVGTLGGNLCQRPRCWYYRDEAYPCLKKGGASCYSFMGRNRDHAILGGGPCFMVHPSDCAPALMALGATVCLLGPGGPREIPLEDFYILPKEDQKREHVMARREMVTGVDIPPHAGKSTYVKFREKEGFDWALASVAAVLELDGQRCKKASIVLGGVAPKPWRATKAQAVLTGKTITESLVEEAGKAALDGARPLSDNAYKIPLAKALVKQAIMKLVS
jgi:xanthine dehydrogenase YagS FAD-binding subunit